MKDECIFCKLANGVIDTNTLYENDDFRVIFDSGPASKGHVLILPKEHYENVYEMPDELAGKAFVLAKKTADIMRQITGCEGVNILQNNGRAAGQTVFHFHMHVIPRYKDGKEMILWKAGTPDQKEIDDIISKAKDMF